jgi:hypothetical protein
MRHIFALLFLPLFVVSLNANALLISDTYVVEKQIPNGTWEGTVFDLTSAGYSPETDSITHIKLIYDFSEIWSLANQGDTDQYEGEDYPEFSEDRPHYEDEPVTFHSWIFNWRDYVGDVDSGLTVFETDWTRNNFCQFEAFDWQNEEVTWCAYNIDVAGTMNASVSSHNDNLWLHSITAEIEVNRVEIPEPKSLFLLGLGLFAIGFLRSRQKIS